MAKFAKVGYGSAGQGLGRTTDGYTYVVNDNVRTKDRIQVISTSSAGRKFPTTAMALHTYKENSAKGQEVKQQTQQAMFEKKKNGLTDEQYQGLSQEEKDKQYEITKTYSGKELGVSQKLKSTPQYVQETRAGIVNKYVQSHPNAELTKNARQTFEDYSKPFMKEGE